MKTPHRVPAAWHFKPMLLLCAVALLVCGVVEHSSYAYVVDITAGPKSIYLQVGAGSLTGTDYSSGGIPGNNAIVNRVSVTVPSASVGTGTQAMTTDSLVVDSAYDSFPYCTVPNEVYIGGFLRTPGVSANATLSVTAPSALTSATGSAIAFNTISWISSGSGDVAPTLPSGTFVGGAAQTLINVARNTWFESCLQFNYANNKIVPPGTFTGRVQYTLTAP